MEQVLRKRNGLIIVAVVSALLRCGTASAQDRVAPRRLPEDSASRLRVLARERVVDTGESVGDELFDLCRLHRGIVATKAARSDGATCWVGWTTR